MVGLKYGATGAAVTVGVRRAIRAAARIAVAAAIGNIRLAVNGRGVGSRRIAGRTFRPPRFSRHYLIRMGRVSKPKPRRTNPRPAFRYLHSGSGATNRSATGEGLGDEPGTWGGRGLEGCPWTRDADAGRTIRP